MGPFTHTVSHQHAVTTSAAGLGSLRARHPDRAGTQAMQLILRAPLGSQHKGRDMHRHRTCTFADRHYRTSPLTQARGSQQSNPHSAQLCKDNTTLQFARRHCCPLGQFTRHSHGFVARVIPHQRLCQPQARQPPLGQGGIMLNTLREALRAILGTLGLGIE